MVTVSLEPVEKESDCDILSIVSFYESGNTVLDSNTHSFDDTRMSNSSRPAGPS